MGRDPVEQKCGEHTYRVLPWPPKLALRMLGKLSKLVGPALGVLADGMIRGGGDESKEPLDMDLSDFKDLSIGTVVSELVDRWEDPMLEDIIDELSSVSFVHVGQDAWPRLSDTFDTHFTGELPELWSWVRFALGVQFGGFFGGSGGLMKYLAQQGTKVTKSTSPSP